MTDITNHLTTSNKRNAYLWRANQLYQTVLVSFPNVRIILSTHQYHGGDAYNSFRLQVHLATPEDIAHELAYFNLSGNYINAPFENLNKITNPYFSPPTMNINCEDYRGMGVSKILMLVAFHFAKKEYPRFNVRSELFIDTDASTIVGVDLSGNKVSYWTAIGMTNNDMNPSNMVSVGYEKRCTLADLNSYLWRH